MKGKVFTRINNIAYNLTYLIKKAALSISKNNESLLSSPKAVPDLLLPEKHQPSKDISPEDATKLLKNIFKRLDEKPFMPPIIDPDKPPLPGPPSPQTSVEQPLNKPEFYYKEFIKYLDGKAYDYHKPLIVYEYILKHKDEVRGELGLALKKFFKRRQRDYMFDFDKFMNDDKYFEETIHKLFRPYSRS